MVLSVSGRSAIACLLALTAAGCTKQADAPEQANAVPLTTQQVSSDEAAPNRPPGAPALKAGKVDRSHQGETEPAAKLATLDGKPTTLAAFGGKPLLVNLWATWCAPCVAELPTLDAAAGRAAASIVIVVLNQGEDAAKVQPFLAKAKLPHLQPLLDPGMSVSLGLAANLPTTVLYDAAGKEVWRVTGDRDWASPDSLKLIAEAG